MKIRLILYLYMGVVSQIVGNLRLCLILIVQQTYQETLKSFELNQN